MATEGGEFSHGLRVVRVVTRRRLRRWRRTLRRWLIALRSSPLWARLRGQLQPLLRRLGAGTRRAELTGRDDAAGANHPGQEAIEAYRVARAITPPPQTYALGENPQRGRQRVESEDRELKRQVTHGLAAEQGAFHRRKRGR